MFVVASSFVRLMSDIPLSQQRSYAERIRGEARKKWLQQIVTAAETGGASMEPVYRAVFNALYKVGSIFLLKYVYRLYQPNLSKHLDDDCMV